MIDEITDEVLDHEARIGRHCRLWTAEDINECLTEALINLGDMEEVYALLKAIRLRSGREHLANGRHLWCDGHLWCWAENVSIHGV